MEPLQIAMNQSVQLSLPISATPSNPNPASQTTKVIKNLTTREAAKVIGLSIAMLHYLHREEIVSPSDTGNDTRGKKNTYSFQDLIILRLASNLLRVGLPPKKLKRAFATLRKLFPSEPITAIPARYIITDGKDILLRDECDIITEITNGGQLRLPFYLDNLDEIRSFLLARLHDDNVGA